MEILGLVSANEVEVPGVATSSGVRVVASRLVSSTAWAVSGRAGKRKAESRSNAAADKVPVIALIELRLGVTMRQRGRFRQNFLAPLELVSNKCPPPQNIFARHVYNPRF